MNDEALDLLRDIRRRVERIEGSLGGKADQDDVDALEVRVRGTEHAVTQVRTLGAVATTALTALVGWLGSSK